MSTKHNVTFLLFCGFALLTVSTQPTAEKIKEGETYTIKIKEKIDPKMEIKWTSPDLTKVATRKNGKNRETIDGATIEINGALKLHNVTVSKTGKYTYQVFNDQGSEIAAGGQDIIVYAKTLKPDVEFKCHNGNASLTCNTQKTDERDLTITWSKGKKDIPGADKTTIHQTATQLLENKEYSCTVHNPVSKAQSDSKAVSCKDGAVKMLFGIDFWLMVSILAGGGALLLLLISVLVICACRSCKQRERQKDEEELRLSHFPQNGQPPTGQRSKVTARGQPAPPIPQEDSLHCDPTTQTPPRTQAQPKGQVRARPPPPPQDEDEEDPPPLPRPRKKRERRNQEPYLPME